MFQSRSFCKDKVFYFRHSKTCCVVVVEHGADESLTMFYHDINLLSFHTQRHP